jgi:hypothetical protein
MKKLVFASLLALLFMGCITHSKVEESVKPLTQKEVAVLFKQKDANFSKIDSKDARVIFENMVVFNSEEIVIDTLLPRGQASVEDNIVKFSNNDVTVIRRVKKMEPGRLDSIIEEDKDGIKKARYRFSVADETYKYIFQRQTDGSFKLLGNAKLYLDDQVRSTIAGTTANGCFLMYYPVIDNNPVKDEKAAEGVKSSSVVVEKKRN